MYCNRNGFAPQPHRNRKFRQFDNDQYCSFAQVFHSAKYHGSSVNQEQYFSHNLNVDCNLIVHTLKAIFSDMDIQSGLDNSKLMGLFFICTSGNLDL